MTTIVRPDSLDTEQIESFSNSLELVGESPRLVGPSGESIELPPALYLVLRDVTRELIRGNVVSIMSLSAVLTTGQAAELLNVSRPFVVKLMDQGTLRHHLAGTHRRVRLSDLLAYREHQTAERESALSEMHQLGDESGMPL